MGFLSCSMCTLIEFPFKYVNTASPSRDSYKMNDGSPVSIRFAVVSAVVSCQILDTNLLVFGSG